MIALAGALFFDAACPRIEVHYVDRAQEVLCASRIFLWSEMGPNKRLCMCGGCISEMGIPCVCGSVVEEIQIAHGVDDD